MTIGSTPPAKAKPLVAAVKTTSHSASCRRALAGRYAAPLGIRDARRKIAKSADSDPIEGSAYPYASRYGA
jgi:hypothetical protein